MILCLKVCVFLFCVVASPSWAEECLDDEECRDIKTCDEEKFFREKNFEEIRKLKVCGRSAGTKEFCCKITAPVVIETKADVPLSDHEFYDQINSKKCGKSNQNRILGGTVADIGSMPWMALLFYKSTKIEEMSGFKCGGTLIASKFVLTAAHCIEIRDFVLVSVRLGEHQISTSLDCSNPNDPTTCNNDVPPIQDIDVDRWIVHENYAKDEISDIALIRLKTEVDFVGKKSVGTICLPVHENQTIEEVLKEESEVRLTVAGWGYFKNDSAHISDVLRYADLLYVSNDECKIRSSKLMCAGMVGGGVNKTDACQGDSGGPLTCPAPNEKGKYRVFQQGIVSKGIPCTSVENAAGIYVRVLPFMKWILDHLGS